MNEWLLDSFEIINGVLPHSNWRKKQPVIRTEIFQRSAGYANGDDPLERVQAGEVRRRLEQHYQTAGGRTPVRIELPVGSYAPQFRWLTDIVEETSRPSPVTSTEIP